MLTSSLGHLVVCNMLKAILVLSAIAGALGFPTVSERNNHNGLDVQISTSKGLLKSSTNGRLVLMFAPNGTDPLEDTDVRRMVYTAYLSHTLDMKLTSYLSR